MKIETFFGAGLKSLVFTSVWHRLRTDGGFDKSVLVALHQFEG